MTEGILNINKPQNMTSHDVVAIARRTLGIKKIGHTGTLDPMATGVLPICIGKSTRIIEYLDMDLKAYRCTMRLGLMTDTQDIWGTVIEERPVRCTEEEIRKAFTGFSGVIWQKPPMYSALKVNGKKLYEYAREGKDVDVKRRQIYINSLKIEEICMEKQEITFTVECSKGTYIRTICQDIGEKLGCLATLTALTRTKSGIFSIEDSLELDDFRQMSKAAVESRMLKSAEPLWAFGKVVTDQINGLRFAAGWHLSLEDCHIVKRPAFEEREFFLPMRDEFRSAYNVFGEIEGEEVFLGVAFYNGQYKKLVADKVFYVR